MVGMSAGVQQRESRLFKNSQSIVLIVYVCAGV